MQTTLHTPPQKSESPAATGQYANQNTNDLDFATGTRNSKAESNLCALLAQAGHAAYPLKDGGYFVSKYGYTHHAIDLEGLHAFAVRLGVCRE